MSPFKKLLPPTLAVLVFGASSAVFAQEPLRRALADRISAPASPAASPVPPDTEAPAMQVRRNVAYGSDSELQRLDAYFPARAGKPLPVVVFVHGGGWVGGTKNHVGDKPRAFVSAGYVFVSVDYRLFDARTGENAHPTQIRDIAKAFAWIRSHASEFSGDPERMFLLGHSAGAHLVALLSTDASYLGAEGYGLASVKGTVALDGAGYDIPRIVSYRDSQLGSDTYEKVFGEDPEKQVLASPVTHVSGTPYLPPFLFLNAGQAFRASTKTSSMMSELLASNGSSGKIVRYENETHGSVNATLGTVGDPNGKMAEVLRFLRNSEADGVMTDTKSVRLSKFAVLDLRVRPKELAAVLRARPKTEIGKATFPLPVVRNSMVVRHDRTGKRYYVTFSPDVTRFLELP